MLKRLLSLPYRYLWLTLAVMLVVVVIWALWRAVATPPATFITETITRGDIEKTVLATGVLEPSVQVNVGAQVNGQLKKLYVKQGERVKKGQLLAEIDPTIQQNELKTAKAQLENVRAQRDSRRALLWQYEMEWRRQQRLNRDGAGKKSDFEQAKAQFESAKEQLRMDLAQIQQAEIAVQTAEANLGYTRILAPVEGEVLGIITQEGQTIVSSQVAPTLLILANLDVMKVRTRISEADILKVKIGQPLSFYVLADTAKRYHSVLDNIQSAPDEALRDSGGMSSLGSGQQRSAIYYSGVFTVANPQHALKTSMTAQVFIVTAQAKKVLRLPLTALGESLGKDRYEVQVNLDGKMETRQIQTGLSDQQFVEVKSGLNEGDEVVITSDFDERGRNA